MHDKHDEFDRFIKNKSQEIPFMKFNIQIRIILKSFYKSNNYGLMQESHLKWVIYEILH